MQGRAKTKRESFPVWKKSINITWKFPFVKPLQIKKYLCFLQDQQKLMKGTLRYFTELTSF